MKPRQFALNFTIFPALLLAACSSGSTTDSPSAGACSPGREESCPCPGSATGGVQRCREDGSGWEPCQCLDGGVAGSGGTDGAAGGGTGGTSLGGSAGASGASGAGGSVDPSGDCPQGLPGPSLVEISAPNGTKYCMDSTEVTYDQFLEFGIAFQYKLPPQPSFCEWNEDMWSDGSAPPSGNHPVTGVNWCQALAYCAWAGKRLCGRVGGGSIGYDGADAPRDANAQEWYGACSSGGTTRFPYGDTFDAEACRTDYDSTVDDYETAPVGSYPACRGVAAPYDSVLDLGGNVGEWTAECEAPGAGTTLRCVRAGASYTSYGEPRDCNSFGDSWANASSPSTGFRCCADPAG